MSLVLRYQSVCLESIGFTLPEEALSSAEIESRLAGLYERLRLPEGRLELITGVRERRLWPAGTWPSQPSQASAAAALEVAGLDPRRVGALVHGSVCRDHLEPATACSVHYRLGLPPECLMYDVSNACLGLLNAAVQVAGLIELGQIQAGIVVGTECSRALLETTIHSLQHNDQLTRDQLKLAIASLTIGSGSAALLLVHRSLSRTGNRVLAAAARADSSHHLLCRSGQDEAMGTGMHPLMETDSEQLLHAGIAAGAANFARLLEASGWTRDSLQRVICHQVGSAHRKQMLSALGLSLESDYSTVDWLGNTGSVALPMTLALAAENGHLRRGDQLALLGIGSGINCLMLALDWQTSLVGRGVWPAAARRSAAERPPAREPVGPSA
jgi:3-oxoacyl-[acyl-carrier-protein] synthase-3